MSENSIVKRMFGGTVAFRATEPCTQMEEPGQAEPDTGIHPPGSFEPAPVEPNGNAICHDIMP